MISVDEALDRIFGLLSPLDTQTVPLRHAAGRVLAEQIVATRNQPPFAASVMDGYGIPAVDVSAGDRFTVVGEAAAGRRHDRPVQAGEAVRIFTGAPVPDGVARVVIQEDVERSGETISLRQGADSNLYIRPQGADFKSGNSIDAPRRLTPSLVSLIAAMNVPEITVYRRPRVALMASGNELVMPGDAPGPDQIIASNTFGLAAMIEAAGGLPHVLPIARDTEDSLNAVFDLATGADLIVTIGGASVGDHDLVGRVAQARGMDRAFHKVAMRPGKPLMSGTLDGIAMIGLPGNPVSSLVCGHVFIRPALDCLLGLPARPLPRRNMPLAKDIDANGSREHYMRAQVEDGKVIVADRQDSALLTVLADANALVVRAPNDLPRNVGDFVQVIDI